MIFALSLALPAVLAIGAVVAWNLIEVRHSQEAELLAVAHSASKTVDLKIARVATIAGALATSDAVIARDWDGARARIDRLDLGPVLGVTVTDALGRPLLDTQAAAKTTVSPRLPRPADVEAATRTTGPVVSDLFISGTGMRKVVAVSQAVAGGDGTIVTVAVAPLALLPTAAELSAPGIAIITIVDRQHRIVARSRNHDRWQGTSATPSMIAAMRRHSEGVVARRSLDGDPMVVAYTRSPMTGWTTMVVVPRDTVLKPVLTNGLAFVLLAAVLLGLGMALSRMFGKALVRDLHRLEDDAVRLGHGRLVDPRPGGVENIDRVQAALSAASSELDLRAARQTLMMNELNHRVKNTLATVQSLAMQTFRRPDADASAKFDKRLAALADAHDLLTQSSWEPVDIRSVVERCARTSGGDIDWSGPPAVLPAQTALALCMCLHELLTNAMKFGALSARSGRVVLRWTVSDDGEIEILWREEGGPPVPPPGQSGFGAKLIDRLTQSELGGEIDRDYALDGLRVRLRIAPPNAARWNNDFG